MLLKLLFFAQCADWLKRREMELDSPNSMALADLLRTRPEFSQLLERQAMLRVAVNQVYSDFTTEVKNGDEVAFLPPFSGG